MCTSGSCALDFHFVQKLKIDKTVMDASFASLRQYFSNGPLLIIVYLQVIPPSLIEMVES
jgi:hypothetical protein